MKKMRVAIIGQGRSGRDIHGKYFQSRNNEVAEVVAIVETIKERRVRAAEEFGCDVYEDYRSLFDRKDIDLVVNATFSQMHYEISKDLLMHGYNVLVEKPMAASYYECQDLILTAKSHNVTIAVFQQYFYSPEYKKVTETIQSGKLGKIRQISIRYNGFARRWDWQTLQACCAGSTYNSGPHPIGYALSLLGWDEDTKVEYAKLDRVLTSGDGDDFAKIILSAPHKPVVDIEIICSDAFKGDFSFKLIGTYGTFSSMHDSYKMKYFDPSKVEARPVIREPLSDEKGMPIYCKEKLDIIEENGEISGTQFDVAVREFYEMLYDTIVNGKPLEVKAEYGAEIVRVIETCHAMNPLPVMFHA